MRQFLTVAADCTARSAEPHHGLKRFNLVVNNERGCTMQIVYELAPVIADIISAHCPGTRARQEFVRACVYGDWYEAKEMVEGMLAEPQYLRGYQENRLREFLELVQLNSPH